MGLKPAQRKRSIAYGLRGSPAWLEGVVREVPGQWTAGRPRPDKLGVRGLQDAEVRQVPVESGEVEPVPDDELVGDREPDVVQRDRHLPARDLVQKRADP